MSKVNNKDTRTTTFEQVNAGWVVGIQIILTVVRRTATFH